MEKFNKLFQLSLIAMGMVLVLGLVALSIGIVWLGVTTVWGMVF